VRLSHPLQFDPTLFGEVVTFERQHIFPVCSLEDPPAHVYSHNWIDPNAS